MPIKTSSAKNKGRKLQQFVCSRITEVFDLEEGDVVSCSMGNSGVDCQLSPAARKVFPVSIECKKTKKWPAQAEMEQAKANTYKDTIGAVCWQPHGYGDAYTKITFDLDDFLKLWKEHTK